MNWEGFGLGALALAAIQGLIRYLFDKKRDSDKVFYELILAVTELKIEIKNLKEVIEPLPKMKGDLTVAHERIRILGKEKGLFIQTTER